MKQIVLLILIMVLMAGCVHTSGSNVTQQRTYLKDSDFEILDVGWGFEDDCQNGNASVGYVDAICSKSLECEVYVNDIRSGYGPDGLQPCGNIVVAEIESDTKPDFVSLQSNNKYYYTRRDRNKFIEICCSYVNENHMLDRDYEICKTTRLDAQCLEKNAIGFRRLTVQSWELFPDGTLTFKVDNEDLQQAVIRKVYVNNKSSAFSTIVPANSLSPTITFTGGPRGISNNGYNIMLSIEYYFTSNANAYFNSTGNLTGSYY